VARSREPLAPESHSAWPPGPARNGKCQIAVGQHPRRQGVRRIRQPFREPQPPLGLRRLRRAGPRSFPDTVRIDPQPARGRPTSPGDSSRRRRFRARVGCGLHPRSHVGDGKRPGLRRPPPCEVSLALTRRFTGRVAIPLAQPRLELPPAPRPATCANPAAWNAATGPQAPLSARSYKCRPADQRPSATVGCRPVWRSPIRTTRASPALNVLQRRRRRVRRSPYGSPLR
jgi:hypothetical protein